MGALISSSRPDLQDLTGRVAIVTGANTGIGYYTVLNLARRGAKVYLGARNEKKAKVAIEKLHADGLGDKPGEVLWLDLDLTYPRNAKKAAEYIITHEKRLDILINNAGKQVTPHAFTSDKLSDSMVINHLSPFLFTNLLLPLMTSTTRLPDADVRIVNVSSTMHTWIAKPKYDSVEALNSDLSSLSQPQIQLYSYTKLANILHAKELQKRLDADSVPIIVTSLHPGVVWTDGAQVYVKTLPLSGLWCALLRIFTIPAENGAYTSLFAAASPAVRVEPEKYKGAYLVPGKIGKPSANAQNPQLAKDLWESSEKALAEIKFD